MLGLKFNYTLRKFNKFKLFANKSKVNLKIIIKDQLALAFIIFKNLYKIYQICKIYSILNLIFSKFQYFIKKGDDFKLIN